MIPELCLLFFAIAVLYAAAGFGGGSSYLAMMALWGVQFSLMRSAALCCNIAVVAGGVYHFWKNGHLSFKKAFQLSVLSVPLAFASSYFPLKQQTFFLLLGVALTAAAVLMIIRMVREKEKVLKVRSGATYSLIGGGIGLLSGMTGIGGGIYLSPVLRLGKYDSPKNIAGLASFFILVNSIAGLAGQAVNGSFTFSWSFTLPLLVAVIAGGQLGARISAGHLKPRWVEAATAGLILYAGMRILIGRL
ncbi:sulfite exporter TauE/SafE family protein [Chitinophaga lutea]